MQLMQLSTNLPSGSDAVQNYTVSRGETGLLNNVRPEAPQWSVQKRPCVVTSKPAIWNGPGRSPYLSCFLLIRQVSFGSPAPRPAFEYMAMME